MSNCNKLYELNKLVQGECLYTHVEIAINGYARASKRALDVAVNEAIEFYNKICTTGNEIEEW